MKEFKIGDKVKLKDVTRSYVAVMCSEYKGCCNGDISEREFVAIEELKRFPPPYVIKQFYDSAYEKNGVVVKVIRFQNVTNDAYAFFTDWFEHFDYLDII